MLDGFRVFLTGKLRKIYFFTVLFFFYLSEFVTNFPTKFSCLYKNISLSVNIWGFYEVYFYFFCGYWSMFMQMEKLTEKKQAAGFGLIILKALGLFSFCGGFSFCSAFFRFWFWFYPLHSRYFEGVQEESGLLRPSILVMFDWLNTWLPGLFPKVFRFWFSTFSCCFGLCGFVITNFKPFKSKFMDFLF